MHRDRCAGLHEANFLCGMGQQHRLERERGICSSYAQAAARVPWVRVSAPALCVALPSPPALALLSPSPSPLRRRRIVEWPRCATGLTRGWADFATNLLLSQFLTNKQNCPFSSRKRGLYNRDYYKNKRNIIYIYCVSNK